MAELKAYYDNFSYMFIPFSFDDAAQFHHLVADLDASADWMRVEDKMRYMFKFVTDKLDGEEKRCAHYALTDDAAARVGLSLGDYLYRLAEKDHRGEKVEFGVRVLDVQLFCFSTSVCLLAYRLNFDDNDPYYIAAAQYHLRKVWKERLYGDTDAFTFMELSEKLLAQLKVAYGTHLFFHANPDTERVNFLTHLNVPEKTPAEKEAGEGDYRQELFFLKWCYHDGFSYYDDTALGDNESYRASGDTVWGLSASAAVCLVNADGARKAFLRDTFYNNFRAEYLFMYVLLLHQKHMMYLLLTKIGVGMNNNLELLESYKQELYEFETDFVFSHVTEVPQYQRLYGKIEHVFALKEMFQDIHEPITALAEVRREANDKQDKQRDALMTAAVFVLSAMTVVSALTDAFGMFDSLGWMLSDTVQHVLQLCGAGGVLAMTVGCFILWIRSKK